MTLLGVKSLESFKTGGIVQVLFLVEPIDEVAITNLQSYKDKKFVDISKEDLDLGKEFTFPCKHTIVSSTN